MWAGSSDLTPCEEVNEKHAKKHIWLCHWWLHWGWFLKSERIWSFSAGCFNFHHLHDFDFTCISISYQTGYQSKKIAFELCVKFPGSSWWTVPSVGVMKGPLTSLSRWDSSALALPVNLDQSGTTIMALYWHLWIILGQVLSMLAFNPNQAL
jgi:hypothetical protein